MTTYYNEIDPYAAQWFRNLIAAGHIALGDVDERSIVDALGNAARDGQWQSRIAEASERCESASGRSSPWGNCIWLPCSDGKARPTEPGIFPLATRIPNRVGRLRAYGNAIVPQVAAEFIKAVMEIT